MERPDYVIIKSDYRIIASFVIDVYIDLIYMLFLCLIWLASKSIQVIVNDIETYFSKIEDVSVYQIIKWKRNYFIIWDWIEEIDTFFGPVLVISVANKFLTTSIYSFRFLNGIFGGTDENPLEYLIEVVKIITAMSGLIFGTQIMKKQVKCTSYFITIIIKDLLSYDSIQFFNKSIDSTGFSFGQST